MKLVDPLESRVLLATQSLENAALIITGTAGDDAISISAAGLQFQVNDGSVKTLYDNADVSLISFDGGSGDDLVTMSDKVKIPARLSGGNGNDTLRGGGGNDTIKGAKGNDSINGGNGNDDLIPGVGDDLVNGDGGIDIADYSERVMPITCDGEGFQAVEQFTIGQASESDVVAGVERLQTGSGNDSLSFMAPFSQPQQVQGTEFTIDSGPGADSFHVLSDTHGFALRLHGGDGDDLFTIEGYPGIIFLFGDAGNDTMHETRGLSMSDTRFTFSGGDGFDSVNMNELLDDITMSLDNIANDGYGNDNILDDIEGMYGTWYYSNYMVGNGKGNFLSVKFTGGVGALNFVNVVIGGDGDDTIIGSDGKPDRLIGGAGDDLFVNADGLPDTIDGGSGFDIAQNDGPDLANQTSVEFLYDQVGSNVQASFRALSLKAARSSAPASSLVTAKLDSNGLLRINGSAGDDSIACYTVSSGLLKVLNRGSTIGSFTASAVKKIRIDAGAGNDKVQLQKAPTTVPLAIHATLIGGDGNDTLMGGSNSDTLQGGAGDDSLSGGDNPVGTRDLLQGGLDNDSLDGGNGNDILNGGDNSIVYNGNTADGNDLLIGGAGKDIADYTRRRENLKLSLNNLADDGAASVHEKDNMLGIETVFSGQGDDTVTGSDAKDLISAGLGEDLLRGKGGNDVLIGANGNELGDVLSDDKVDTVYGDGGFDLLALQDGHEDHYSGGSPGAAGASQEPVICDDLDLLDL